MSTQTLKDRVLVDGISTGKTTTWLKPNLTKLLARKKQLMLLGGGALAILALAGIYFWSTQEAAPQYMTAKVERGNLRNTVSATGTLQAVTTVQVGSQASGTISALLVDFNSVVKKGQVVAQLDPSVAQAQVQQANANLQQARAGLTQARAGVANSRAGVSDAQARALAAKSTVQNQQAGVSSSEANLAVLKSQQDDALVFLRQQESLYEVRASFRNASTTWQTLHIKLPKPDITRQWRN